MEIAPAVSVRGAAAMPGDKSISHRALMIGAVCEGDVEVTGLGHSLDTAATLEAVQSLGARVETVDEDRLRIVGVGLQGLREPSAPIACRNAGTLARLLPGLLAAQEGCRFELLGDSSLSRRPMDRIATPLREMGATLTTTDGHLPMSVEGGPLTGIEHRLDVASAQVKSCVLIAGLNARGATTVIEPVSTRDHTERLLRAAGASVVRSGERITVQPARELRLTAIEVPGDASAAAPFVLAATLLPGSDLILSGVGVNPARVGFLEVLERMGARIALFNRRMQSGEPVADIAVAHAELVATEVHGREVPGMIDELPLFCLAAAMAHGASRVRGAAELRAKESDRIETVTRALRAIGLHVAETPDGFRIRGVPTRPRGGVVSSGGDHRLAILGAVAGLVSRDGVKIEGAEDAAVSFPGFYELLDALSQR